MEKNSYSGKLIVFEGLDGSGKSTQANLLASRLKENGYNVVKIDFPQYGKKSAGSLEEYLNGKYGSSEEVGPYRASIFYAVDRYDLSFAVKRWLKEGKIIVCDRYVASNIGHQGGKIKNKKERRKYIRWLYDLEYGIFDIPRPNATFILKTSSDFSLKLAHKIKDKEKLKKRRDYLGKKIRDIHEKDKKHLDSALVSYLDTAKMFPREFKVVECLKNGNLLSPEQIHQELWKKAKKIISKIT